MYIIRFSDGKENTWANGQRRHWVWRDIDMHFTQEGVNIQKSYLEYDGTRLMTWDGLLRPEDVWDDITAIMLEDGVICELLAKIPVSLQLPDMEGP